ncbi:hypothetical protein SISSUDRAFT_1048776, partial [Sistotremastrum suecicum HHB10207 ss-3]
MHPAESGISKRTASRKVLSRGRKKCLYAGVTYLGGRTLCITGLSNWFKRPWG